MVVLNVENQDYALTGTAPQEEGKSFRILNGIEVLWEGKGGESFHLVPHCRKVYLVSVDSDNKAWDIEWKPEQNNRAMTGHVVLQGDSVPCGPAM